MDRVLVVGATGYIGGNLARSLVCKGYSVRGMLRNPAKASELSRLGIEPIEGDIRDPAAVERAVHGIDVVYNVAGLFRQENVSRRQMWETHVQGPRNLIETAAGAGVKRYVHCSTVGVHGDIKHPPANEEAPYGPGDKYQETKTEGEQLVLGHMHKRTLPIVIFRPTGVYGPGDMRFLKLVRAINKRLYLMVGSGNVKFHAIYISDLVDGIHRCGTREEAPGNVYILAGEEPITLNNLFTMIAKALRVNPIRVRLPFAPLYFAGYLCELVFKPLRINPPLYRRRVKFYKNTRWFDISKAKRELGYQPVTDMHTGIETTVEWYRQAGLL